MRITVKGKHMQVTPAIREHAEGCLERLNRFYHRLDEATVTVSTERSKQMAEITLHCGSLLLRAEENTTDLYASIEAATDKLERQLRRFKERIKNHHSKQKPSTALQGEAEEEIVEASAPDVEHAAADAQLVRTKRFVLKPTTTEEAMLQLELLGHSFFVFQNADTEQVNVLYRRNDGDFGLIEPEE